MPSHLSRNGPGFLARLELPQEDCIAGNAGWGLDGEATPLSAMVPGVRWRRAELLAAVSLKIDHRVHLIAVVDAPFVTIAAFEAAMVRFAAAGFPRAPHFQLLQGDSWLRLPDDSGLGE